MNVRNYLITMAAIGVLTPFAFIDLTPRAITSQTTTPQQVQLAERPLEENPLAVAQAQPIPAASSPIRVHARPQQPIHPDEPISTTLNDRFSVNNALERIEQIHSALNSFRRLTETRPSAPEITADTDWETQNLGFHNWVGAIEGTVRRQQLEIAELKLELAQKQFEDGEITAAQLDQQVAAHQQAAQEFQTFWDHFSIAD